MNELERAKFDLEMIQPYVNFLKDKIAREKGRISQPNEERRRVVGTFDDRKISAIGIETNKR